MAPIKKKKYIQETVGNNTLSIGYTGQSPWLENKLQTVSLILYIEDGHIGQTSKNCRVTFPTFTPEWCPENVA